MTGRDWQLDIGARPEPGGVRFRVWAPTSASVDVVVYGPDAEAIHPLPAANDGYFTGFVPGVGPGTRYRYRLDSGPAYPDPASRSQPDGVHGPSEVIDPADYSWRATDWFTPPFEEAIIYELHVGTFTAEGTFDAAAERFGQLAELGVTAIEVMPIANFPGERNWGYDGVNLFAPATAYGGPEGFRRFVDAAHAHGLAVILDVVYNHLGPEGNYIPAMTGGLVFTDRHKTPWGDAINFDGPGSEGVRHFVIQNALYWLHEFRVDGLRLDATHTIIDTTEPHILQELADRVHSARGPARWVIAEDDRNLTRLVQPRSEGGFGMDAVWADDLHHQIRRGIAGDSHGYYAFYSGTVADLSETLRRGWWRESSVERDRMTAPAESTRSRSVSVAAAGKIEPTRFVHCIQNHDQVGNRATGERLNHEVPAGVYRAVSTLLLVSPYTPLLWMGQEWAASSPFQYFTDHPPELGRRVTEGRRGEFSRFPAFSDPEARDRIPDPQLEATFLRSKLDWAERADPEHAAILALYRTLLALRRTHPALRSRSRGSFDVRPLGEGALAIRRCAGDAHLLAVINLRGEIRMDLGASPITAPPADSPWPFLLSSEEIRFGGSGAWGSVEMDGSLHVVVPGAVLLG